MTPTTLRSAQSAPVMAALRPSTEPTPASPTSSANVVYGCAFSTQWFTRVSHSTRGSLSAQYWFAQSRMVNPSSVSAMGSLAPPLT
eukprot:CAMPEP_0198439642 /NCGR_PEP_ID=MMETSP1452-20131203/55703_1 /TAXON_ID=1181717 /ORGANISM="Synchroma pusillum, Strain CCMP3072" /LENGTH=85 /DNA_ID=CAMNT_0044160253 /DNA_START=4 /DNA_END=257 /DNA_ORIENTATION=+